EEAAFERQAPALTRNLDDAPKHDRSPASDVRAQRKAIFRRKRYISWEAGLIGTRECGRSDGTPAAVGDPLPGSSSDRCSPTGTPNGILLHGLRKRTPIGWPLELLLCGD